MSERQFPSELTTRVGAFRSALPTLAAELEQGLDPAQAQTRINQACDAVVAALNDFTRDDMLIAIGMDDPLTFR